MREYELYLYESGWGTEGLPPTTVIVYPPPLGFRHGPMRTLWNRWLRRYVQIVWHGEEVL